LVIAAAYSLADLFVLIVPRLTKLVDRLSHTAIGPFLTNVTVR